MAAIEGAGADPDGEQVERLAGPSLANDAKISAYAMSAPSRPATSLG